MSTDAPVNTGAPGEATSWAVRWVSRMQAKLHHWAVADPGRRFDDLFNLVYDPEHAEGGVGAGRGQHRGQVRRRRWREGPSTSSRTLASQAFLDDLGPHGEGGRVPPDACA